MKISFNKLLQKIDISQKALVIILVGSLSWSLTMVKSGLMYNFGTGFWGPNGHDGVWHIALAEGFARGSWEIPIFAGETIKNYHVGFDLLLATLHKLTMIPMVNLYFQVLPPLIALGIGYFVYRFVRNWKGNSQALWSLFFVYFGGSFGWIITFLRDGDFGGESMFWSQQAISTLINPPFALSLLMIFAGLNFMIVGMQENKTKYLMISSILFGLLAQVKIYSAVLILGGLFVIGMGRLLMRKGTLIIRVFMGSLTIALLLTLPVIDTSQRSLQFAPFWFLETMMGFTDRFYWPRFSEAMMNYRLGGNWLKYGIATTVAFFIFWYGNLGTRFLWKIGSARKLMKKQKTDFVEMLLVLMIFAGAIIPMLVVQTGTPWNTIQFFYYSLVFSAVLSGVYFSKYIKLVENKYGKYLLMTIVVIFTIPTSIATLYNHYLPSRPPAKISPSELEALEFLRDQSDGVVLTIPFDRDAALDAINNPPRPLYLYESTAYVAAFSSKPVYLEDEVNLNITGYGWQERRQNALEFYESTDQAGAGEFLVKNNIDYIYLIKAQTPKLNTDLLSVEEIFENDEIFVFQVDRI